MRDPHSYAPCFNSFGIVISHFVIAQIAGSPYIFEREETVPCGDLTFFTIALPSSLLRGSSISDPVQSSWQAIPREEVFLLLV